LGSACVSISVLYYSVLCCSVPFFFCFLFLFHRVHNDDQAPISRNRITYNPGALLLCISIFEWALWGSLVRNRPFCSCSIFLSFSLLAFLPCGFPSSAYFWCCNSCFQAHGRGEGWNFDSDLFTSRSARLLFSYPK